MRSLAAAQTKLIQATGGCAWHWYVEVDDGTGTHRNLSTLFDVDWCEAVSYGAELDQQVGSCKVSLRREANGISLAPLMAASRANLLTGSYSPLLKEGRTFKVYVQAQVHGLEPVASAWFEVFRGKIDRIDASQPVLTFEGRDLGGWLTQGTFIESEVAYAASPTAVETVMQSILTAWSTGLTLYTPVSPGFSLNAYLQKKEPVQDALQTLAMLTGWEVRYRWSNSLSDFRLTFQVPDRTKTTADWTLTAHEYTELSSHTTQMDDVRNAWEVVYSDSADLDTSGRPIRKTVTATDSTSITAYGRRWAQIAEDESSPIDSAAEANVMVAAALADTKNVLLEKAVAAPFLPQLELGDLVAFTANNVTESADQKLAVKTIQHELTADGARTTLTCRGQPSLGIAAWLRVEARPWLSDAATFSGPNQPGTVTATPTPGGAVVVFTPAATGFVAAEYEAHLSTSSGFTPGASTLYATSATNNFSFESGLVSGQTYYVKIRPRAANGSYGTTSAQTSFVAGYAKAGFLSNSVEWARSPLNGGFETRTATSGTPDHWTINTGTYGTHVDYVTGSSDAISGDAYLRLRIYGDGTYVYVDSRDYIPVDANTTYRLEAWFKVVTGTGTAAGGVLFMTYNSALSQIGSVGAAQVTLSTAAGAGWQKKAVVFTTGSTAKYVKLSIYCGMGSGSADMYVDGIRFERVTFMPLERIHRVRSGADYNLTLGWAANTIDWNTNTITNDAMSAVSAYSSTETAVAYRGLYAVRGHVVISATNAQSEFVMYAERYSSGGVLQDTFALGHYVASGTQWYHLQGETVYPANAGDRFRIVLYGNVTVGTVASRRSSGNDKFVVTWLGGA